MDGPGVRERHQHTNNYVCFSGTGSKLESNGENGGCLRKSANFEPDFSVKIWAILICEIRSINY